MRGRRERIIDLVTRLGGASLLLAARRQVRLPWLTALAYHRVGRPDPEMSLDDAVIDATPEQFDEQVALLKQHFSLVGTQELLAWQRGGTLPPNPAVITFDDGYLDCHTHALPILRRHRAPAIFFVPTWHVSERRAFWWDRINFLMKASPHQQIELTYPAPVTLDLTGDRYLIIKSVLKVVKTRFGLDIERFLQELGERCGVSWDTGFERRVTERTLMTWDHIRDLRSAGLDVQSHGRTHRVLQTLPPAELRAELRDSRAELEQALGEVVRTIAYPVGYPIGSHPAIRTALSEAGYEVGFSCATGVSHTVRRPDRFDIRRIAVDSSISTDLFRAIVALPHLARAQTA